MSMEFKATAASASQIFAPGSRYVTPDYQRRQAWTSVEVGQLLEDLLFELDENQSAAQTDSAMFLGTIVLIRRPAEPGDKDRVYEIVDGQQRLATLTMLLCVLRDFAGKDGQQKLEQLINSHIEVLSPVTRLAGEREWRVHLHPEDEPVFVQHVKTPGACLVPADPEDFEGPQRALLLNRALLIAELGALEAQTRAALAEFVLEHCNMVVVATDQIDRAFRIFMAVNLPGKPLSRNDILKAEILASVAAADRARLTERWHDAERAIGPDFEQFFSHLRAALGSSRNTVIAEVRRLIGLYGGGRPFLEQALLPMAEIFAVMRGRKVPVVQLEDSSEALLRYLDWLSHTEWTPSGLLYLHFQRNDDASIRSFLEALDKFSYGQMLLGVGRNKRIVRYARAVEAIRAGGMTFGAGGPFALSPEDERNIIYNATTDLYARNSVVCKLLLLRLNDAMAGSPSGLAPADVTVEHVLPQRLKKSSEWRSAFSDADRQACTGSLGNLILVSPETNRLARNDEFRKKLDAYKADPLIAALPLNAAVIDSATWTPDHIREREALLVGQMRSLWGFGLAAQERRLAG